MATKTNSISTQRLRAIRLARGLTLEDVGRMCSVSAATVSRIERGQQRPSPDVAECLAKIMGGAVTEMELLYPRRYQSASAIA